MAFLFFMYLTKNGAAESYGDINASFKYLDTLSRGEILWLRDHPVITVVTDPYWPPVEFTDENGDPTGMSMDYLKLVEQRLGIKFKRLEKMNWQDAYSKLKSHKIDMTTCVAETPERKEFWAFTKPYMKIPVVIATQLDVPYISGLHELAARKVAVVDGYAVDDWIRTGYPEINIVRVRNALDGLHLLQQGEVYAYVDNLLIIGDYQAKMQITNIKIAGQTPYVNAQCIAVRKDWAILAGIIQKALNTITETEQKEIYRRWLPVRYEYGFNYSLFRKALAGFVIIVFLLALWVWKLAAEIKSRKIAEEKIRALLAEKELLLSEVHHRIKNNMNTVKGLLTLQLSAEHNPQTVNSLRDAESRVQSMIMLYDRLYCTENFREMPIKDYLQSLAEEIIGSYPNRGIVNINNKIEDFILNIQLLTPVGIIINELLSNIMEHAFSGRESGEITVSAVKNGKHVIIIIQDDGIGLPETIIHTESSGFGLDLVDMLIEQIGGKLSIERSDGTKFSLEFNV